MVTVKLCSGCSRNLALVGRVHRCTPVPAGPAVPGGPKNFVTMAVTEQPRRIDTDRIRRSRSSKLFRVKVDGRIIIPKTPSPFAIFGSLAVQGWSGKVELWRDRKLVGERSIEAEARRVIAAHDRLTLRKGRYR